MICPRWRAQSASQTHGRGARVLAPRVSSALPVPGALLRRRASRAGQQESRPGVGPPAFLG
eukprot:6983205-Pyramimonas_sp.AAC.1